MYLTWSTRKKTRLEASGSLDADDPIEDESDDSVDEEDEDDTAELMAELQRIKAERAADLAKKVIQSFFFLLNPECFLIFSSCMFVNQGNGTKTGGGAY